MEESYTCDTDTDNAFANVDADNNNQTWFYCAPEQELNRYISSTSLALSDLAFIQQYIISNLFLYRKQLSAQDQLWCVDECIRNDTAQGYTCNTLYGPDLCSPSEGKTVSGSQCSSPCTLDDGKDYYSCYTDKDESTWEYCGFHGVPEEKKGVLEFTIDDVVCADYCGKEKRGGDLDTCSVVDWYLFKGNVSANLLNSSARLFAHHFLLVIPTQPNYRVTKVVADLGLVDLDLGSSPGSWAATVATYCPSQMVQHPKYKSTQFRSATTFVTLYSSTLLTDSHEWEGNIRTVNDIHPITCSENLEVDNAFSFRRS